MVQHLAMFDYVAVSGSWEDRVIEYVDHLHEHFVDPVELRDARYVAPTSAGGGARMVDESLRQYGFPDGDAWRGVTGAQDAIRTSAR
jgi:L-fuconate dehydratase